MVIREVSATDADGYPRVVQVSIERVDVGKRPDGSPRQRTAVLVRTSRLAPFARLEVAQARMLVEMISQAADEAEEIGRGTGVAEW